MSQVNLIATVPQRFGKGRVNAGDSIYATHAEAKVLVAIGRAAYPPEAWAPAPIETTKVAAPPPQPAVKAADPAPSPAQPVEQAPAAPPAPDVAPVAAPDTPTVDAAPTPADKQPTADEKIEDVKAPKHEQVVGRKDADTVEDDEATKKMRDLHSPNTRDMVAEDRPAVPGRRTYTRKG